MAKQKLTMEFSGECYIKAYGRKLYKKGVILKNIRDEQSNTFFEEIKVSKTSALTDLEVGKTYEIEAEVVGDTLKNIKILGE